jgi:NADH-quinone oxidoreductase subunit A
MLKGYIPIFVFAALGIGVGGAFAMLNYVIGRKVTKQTTVDKRLHDPYECGLPVEVTKTFRFGVSFYLVAMLFILFDIEVVFLYPVGVILNSADSVFVLVEVILFIFLLTLALVYVWRKGALNWK